MTEPGGAWALGSVNSAGSKNTASSGAKSRPSIGVTPRILKRLSVTQPDMTSSATPSPVMVPLVANAPANPSNCVVSLR